MSRKRTKQPWHTGNHYREGRRLTAMADTTPDAICWRCGLTRHQHPPRHKTGRPAQWTFGHTWTATHGPTWTHITTRPPGTHTPNGYQTWQPWKALEWSTCNYHDGATIGAQRTRGKAKNQPQQPAPTTIQSTRWGSDA